MALTMPNLELISHDWRKTASCRDTDPELFFPVGTTGSALVQISSAKSVCETCACKAECLEFALVTNQDSGVWGGASEEERRQIRRHRRAEARARKQEAAAAALAAGS